ncbi:hypothetical protein RG47T_1676 [Mucilaginibacter polytrichastri]|uniref:Uncharacterized protein n=1 Tax=Mucilaginibacter polytrichastri TaxID=1302689 RepID=A0A1Q5ZWT1_9SPHI|nr:hypothetical protein RG47T_1676 [Mucilaginibacter polytrichastri]
MEKLIRIIQQYLTSKQGPSVVLIPVKANNYMQACCCCC